MSYAEFVKLVRDNFKKCGDYTDKETDDFLAKNEKMLREHYEGFTNDNIAGYSPIATASCLDMMF